MNDECPMSVLLARYLRNELDRKQLEGQLFIYLRDNPQRIRLGSWCEEDRIDFLCWFYPRMRDAIDKYKACGSNFDSYLSSLIKWSAIEFRSKEADCHALERACWKARARDIVAEDEIEYGYDDTPFEIQKNPRQVLMLTLKCCSYLSDDFSHKVASAIGMNEEYLQCLIDGIRRMNAIKAERLRVLEEHSASQYFRCIAFEARMKAAPEGSAHRADMEQRLIAAKQRLVSMRRRLAHMMKDATNKEIAEVLGIPKGTVDSCLSAVHHKLAKKP
ncbi:hypothetical protein MASR2M78_04540 [Treponema sp.]